MKTFNRRLPFDRFFSRRRIPLRWLLMVPLTVVMTGTTALVGYLALRAGEEASNQLAIRLLQQTTDQIETQIAAYLDLPHRLNQLVASAVDEGWVRAERESSERFLWQLLDQHPTLGLIYVGEPENGAFVGVRRNTNRSIQVMISDSTTDYQRGYYATNQGGQRAGSLRIEPDPYDSRLRPWFQKALAQGAPIWTDPYASSTTGELLITASQPVYSAEGFLGVVGSDITLADISTFLQTLRLGTSGTAFIVTSDNQLIGTSDVQAGATPIADRQGPVQTPSSRDVITLLESQGIPLRSIFGLVRIEIEWEGQQFYIAVSRFQDVRGLSWVSVVVLPKAEVFAPIWEAKQITIGLMVVFIALSVGIAILLSRRIVNPITQLGEASRALTDGNLKVIRTKSGIHEIERLTVAFNQMSAQLQRSLLALRQLNQELEAKVEQRTQALRASEAIFRGVFENSPVGISLNDMENREVKVSPSLTHILGYSLDELLSSITYRDYTHPEDREKDDLLWQSLMANEHNTYTLEKRCIRKDGQIIWVRTSMTLIRDPSGTPTMGLAMLEDITQDKESEQRILRQSEFLNQLIDTLPALIVVRNTAHQTRLINQAYGNFYYGITNRESLIGLDEAQRFADLWQTIVDEDNQVIETGKELHIPPHIEVGSNGQKRWIQFIKRPLTLPESGQMGILLVGTDITDLKEAQDKAEAANQAKSTFLANMSHELRTPLNAVIGFSQLMLRDPDLTEKQQETLGTINRSGEHLLGLINDVLDLAKIESGKMILQEDTFDLHDTLKTLHAILSVRAQDKGIRLRFERDKDVPPLIKGDAKKLRQVLINLVANGIKFTSEGEVVVRVNRVPNPGSLMELEFAVSDTGLGMSPDELSLLFQAFVQTDTSKKVSEGTGLGLAISRQFVQLMGGDITVTSQKGLGSTFSFRIPVKLGEQGSLAEDPAQAMVTGLAPGQPIYRLLVVDDAPDNRAVLQQLFSGLGFEVREGINGQEAVDLWQHWDPHLIWMDLRMPVMDGFEATRQIREQMTTTYPDRQTKIIALSASGFEDDRHKAQSIGFDEYVSKPFREITLFEVLKRHLQLRFIYQSNQHSAALATPRKPDPLTTEQLQIMPPDWIQQFHQAAISLNNRRMKELISQIPPEHSALIETLTQMVRKVMIDAILAVTSPLVD